MEWSKVLQRETQNPNSDSAIITENDKEKLKEGLSLYGKFRDDAEKLKELQNYPGMGDLSNVIAETERLIGDTEMRIYHNIVDSNYLPEDDQGSQKEVTNDNA